MADTRARWLKIAARVLEDEVPQGRPADWLAWVSKQYSLRSFIIWMYGYCIGQVTSGNWSLGYYLNVP